MVVRRMALSLSLMFGLQLRQRRTRVGLPSSGYMAGMGSWRQERSAELEQLAERLGYVVFDVEYRMPPPVRWKEEIGDVKCALGWVVGNAEKYGIDASRISIMGYSAGANLAMLAAYSADFRRRSLPRVQRHACR